MKSIEERAKAPAKKIWSGGQRDWATAQKMSEQDFIVGAKSEREELLRWRDPKKELPETGVEVLVKIDTMRSKYDIMKHNEYGWWQKAPVGGWCAPKYKPVGWRYIHEFGG